MSLTKDDLDLIQQMFDAQNELFDEKLDTQRSAIMFDVRIQLRQELEDIRERIDRLKMTEDEDIRMVFGDVEKLRKGFSKLELELAKCKKSPSRG